MAQRKSADMLRVEKTKGAENSYHVVWGGRAASRDTLKLNQAYAVMWILLRVIFGETSISLSSVDLRSEEGFVRTMVDILEGALEIECVKSSLRVTLREEKDFWERQLKKIDHQKQLKKNSAGEQSSEDNEVSTAA